MPKQNFNQKDTGAVLSAPKSQPENDNKAHVNNPGSNPPGTGPGDYKGNNDAKSSGTPNNAQNQSNDDKSYANNPEANPPGSSKAD